MATDLINGLYAGSAAAAAAAQPPELPSGSSYGEQVEASSGEGLHFSRGGQTVWFGDSAQDVWSELGIPSGTSSKPLDAMAMSSQGNHSSGQASADFFYHYTDR